jgi:hypothetical protein
VVLETPESRTQRRNVKYVRMNAAKSFERTMKSGMIEKAQTSSEGLGEKETSTSRAPEPTWSMTSSANGTRRVGAEPEGKSTRGPRPIGGCWTRSPPR